MSPKAEFDAAPPPGTINFGIGQPGPHLLPVHLFHVAAEHFFTAARPLDFNYAEKQGDSRFRESLAQLLTRQYGVHTTPGSLFLTAGTSQAIDFVCARFTRPGDTVFVEEPSYFLAFQIFRDHGLNIVSVPLDEEGLSIELLEAELDRHRPRLVYTIPSFSNPAGQTLPAGRRERLVELSREHGFLVVADEVYQMLPCYGEVPPALGTMIDRGNVLSLGSFSKILAPGLRLGWIQTSAELMEPLLESGWVSSGGAVNHVMSLVVHHAIESGLQERHIAGLHEAYRKQLESMEEALQEHLARLARWIRPDGGYFFWLEMDEQVDTTPLRSKALQAGTGFQPGALFSAQGRLQNWLRLSFAHYDEDEIREGVARLAKVIKEQLTQTS
jgi:DNA-binding transcriptional MocR family regulator